MFLAGFCCVLKLWECFISFLNERLIRGSLALSRNALYSLCWPHAKERDSEPSFEVKKQYKLSKLYRVGMWTFYLKRKKTYELCQAWSLLPNIQYVRAYSLLVVVPVTRLWGHVVWRDLQTSSYEPNTKLWTHLLLAVFIVPQKVLLAEQLRCYF